MKKLMLTLCLVLGLVIAPMAMADTLKVKQDIYSYGSGGEFVVVESGYELWYL